MVPIIVGAAIFQAAYSGATQFDNDARLRDWRHVLFYPAFSSQVQPGLRRCFSDADAKSGAEVRRLRPPDPGCDRER
jgi:hypothetical protein